MGGGGVGDGDGVGDGGGVVTYYITDVRAESVTPLFQRCQVYD